jgi:hypothetical protein
MAIITTNDLITTIIVSVMGVKGLFTTIVVQRGKSATAVMRTGKRIADFVVMDIFHVD